MLDVSEQPDCSWRVLKVGPRLYGTGNFVEQWRKVFKTFQDIPTKTKEAVACLSMCNDNERIKGVGQKVSSKTYWIDDTSEILTEYKGEKV